MIPPSSPNPWIACAVCGDVLSEHAKQERRAESLHLVGDQVVCMGCLVTGAWSWMAVQRAITTLNDGVAGEAKRAYERALAKEHVDPYEYMALLRFACELLLAEHATRTPEARQIGALLRLEGVDPL